MCQYNLQGDIIGMIAGHHTKVLRYEYDAWGKQLSSTGSRKDDMGIQNPFRYRHYQYDDETGLYYLNSRYYSPELGRFISADSIYKENLYAYCHNSPISYVDRKGTEPYKAYDSPEVAAYYFVQENHPLTLADNKERMAIIYSKVEWNKEESNEEGLYAPKTVYYYGDVYTGMHNNVILPFIIQYVINHIGQSNIFLPSMHSYVHTHPQCECHSKGGTVFSDTDKLTAKLFESGKVYLGDSLGNTLFYIEKEKEVYQFLRE